MRIILDFKFSLDSDKCILSINPLEPDVHHMASQILSIFNDFTQTSVPLFQSFFLITVELEKILRNGKRPSFRLLKDIQIGQYKFSCHCILIKRHTEGKGWSISYEFSNTDYTTCELMHRSRNRRALVNCSFFHAFASTYLNLSKTCLQKTMLEIFHPSYYRHNTRSSTDLPYQNSSFGQKTLSCLGPQKWNDLPAQIKLHENVNTFKHDVKKSYFKKLQKENDDNFTYY